MSLESFYKMYESVSDTSDVSKLLGVNFPIKFANLKMLWEAGFGIYNLYCITKEDGTKNIGLWFFDKHNLYVKELSISQYNFWLLLLYQVSKIPILIDAFTEEAVSINPYLEATLYKRSICCISAQRSNNSMTKNKRDTMQLKGILKEFGYFPILLQGVFYEQDEYGNRKANEGELSYLVVSRKGEDPTSFANNMFDLGVRYKQDSVLMRDVDSKNAYYWGTSNTDTPDTFKPGLNVKAYIGELVPYKSGFCSTPLNVATMQLKLDDAFAFWTPSEDGEDLLYKRNSNKFVLVQPNIYSNGNLYRYRVIKNEVVYYGYSRNLLGAKKFVERIRRGSIPINAKRRVLK